MSALLRPQAERFVPMTAADLDDVARVEQQIYPFPWSRGNFADSLNAGYSAWVLRDAIGALQSYAIMMLAVDEAHLLNLSVARDAQRRGLGWCTLEWIAEVARGHGAHTLLLEVRPSNPAALRLYERYGFERVGLRRGYYPAQHGREDALVMRVGAVTLDARRARLWTAMGLGPQWVLRTSEAAEPLRETPVAPADGLADVPVDAPNEPATTDAGDDARAQRIARMSWEELQAAVAGCTACGLCRTRTQTVFGVGNRTAHCMIVGEAPGAEEDARGEPFVGQAGRLLDNMLAAIGLSRAQAEPPSAVYIANVLKCRPPGNRNPAPEEVAHCEPHLLRQIALVQPKLVLVMGRFAVQSLLGTDASIASLRGRVHHIDVAARRVPVVVTYHPAYLLRNLADKSRSWADLCLARRTLAG